MRTQKLLCALVAAAASLGLAASLSADVRTREKTQLKIEGFMGGMIAKATGLSGDGLTSTVAVKGTRKSSINDRTGQIVDLAEEKIYELDIRRKEFTVTTFEEMRERIRKAREDAEKAARDMPQEERQEIEEGGKEIEIDYDVRETGEAKSIAGHATRQVIMTITMREKGKTLEDGGGMVMTNDLWLAQPIAALDEIREFDMKYFQAVYGEAMAGMPQLGAMFAAFPSMQTLMERAQAEGGKLTGTPLVTTMTIESVKSAEQMKAAQAQQSGGGLAGRFARRVMNRNVQQRSTMMTTTHELLSIDPTAVDGDVAIPAGFKEKR